jgi:hypothetical protein
MTVFYGDIAKEFVPHYFQQLNDSAPKFSAIYTDDAQLQVDALPLVTGPAQIVAELAKLGRLTPQQGRDSFVAQPYKDAGVIITTTARSEGAQFVFTFVVAPAGDSNRFGVTHQLVHTVPA